MTASATCSPTTLILDLSYACNLNCITCLCPEIDASIGSPQLSLETARRAIAEFVAMSGQKVEIYGGEPLLVRSVYEVVAYAASAGLRTEITTNGIPASLPNARRLLAAGLSSITISLDGDPEGHERIRGVGTFSQAMQGARNLISAAREFGRDDFRLALHITVSRANVDSFAALIDHAAQLDRQVTVSVAYLSLVPPEITFQMEALLQQESDPARNHWRLPRELLVTPDQIQALKSSVVEMKRRAIEKGILLRMDPALDEPSDAQALFDNNFALKKRCKVFESTLILGPDGVIGSCPMLTHFSFGQFGRDSFKTVWRDDGPFALLRQQLRNGYLPICRNCCDHSELM